jgi:hypothetical protein
METDMSKKSNGITPEELEKLIARIKALPIVQPKIIPTCDAIFDHKAIFREAIKKGHNLDQLVDMWNEHGSNIVPGTFAGYLRNSKKTTRSGKNEKREKVKGATSQNIEPHDESKSSISEIDATPTKISEKNLEHELTAEKNPPKIDAEQIKEPVKTASQAEEDAMVDAILAQRPSDKAIGLDDGKSG